MKTDEIRKMVNRKGKAVKDAYEGFFNHYKDYFWIGTYEIDGNEEIVATYSYNCMILLMKKILDNPVFFEKVVNIKQRQRNRIIKDLENMQRLEYPDECSDYDFEEEEKYCVDSMSTNINDYIDFI